MQEEESVSSLYRWLLKERNEISVGQAYWHGSCIWMTKS